MAIFAGPEIPNDGLMFYLDAANGKSYLGTGTTFRDISGQGLSVTMVNGVVFGSNRMQLDGIDDYFTGVTLPNTTGQLTFEITMNYVAMNAYHNIFDRLSARPMLWVDIQNRLESSFRPINGGLLSDGTFAGQNVCVSATYNSVSSPGLQLYVNGELNAQREDLHVSWPNPSTFTLFNRDSAGTFSGSVYSLRFYNRILSPLEIRQNFEATRSRYGI